jgi:hypothetical protein
MNSKLILSLVLLFSLANLNELFAQKAKYEGFGAATRGGKGKKTVHVTNLNTFGAGSLYEAIGSDRTIVFDVGGTINNFRYDGSKIANLTIDGSTAPAPGITISNNNNGSTLEFYGAGCHDIIVTNIRFRGNPGRDNITITEGAYNIVLDHLSTSGSHDGGIDITAGSHDITVQYCLLGPGAADWAGPMLIAYSPTKNVSIHHNLFSSATRNGVGERNPLIHSSNAVPANLMVDFRNNLVYKWGRNAGTGSGFGTGVSYNGTANLINNYYYSSATPASAVMTGDYGKAGSGGKAHMSGNISGNAGVDLNKSSNHEAWPIAAAGTVVTQDACTAARKVLAEAGPRPLDAIDKAFFDAVILTNCPAVKTPPATTKPATNTKSSKATPAKQAKSN